MQEEHAQRACAHEEMALKEEKEGKEETEGDEERW
jgi:hypothetical protein